MFWRKKPIRSKMTNEAKKRQQFAIWDYYRNKKDSEVRRPPKKK